MVFQRYRLLSQNLNVVSPQFIQATLALVSTTHTNFQLFDRHWSQGLDDRRLPFLMESSHLLYSVALPVGIILRNLHPWLHAVHNFSQ